MKFNKPDFLILFPQWLIMIAVWVTMMGQNQSGIWFKTPSLIHDWAFHFGMISNLVYRSLILKYHPLFWQQPFRYNFTFDVLSAILVRLGISMPDAIVMLGVIFSCLLVTILYLFYRGLFHSRLAAVVSCALFIANGTGGFGLLGLQLSNQLDWGNFFVHEISRQPGFLLGLPITLWLFQVLWKTYQGRRMNKKGIFIIGLVIGVLPIIHLPSFLVVTFTYVFVITLYARHLIWMFFPTVILGTLQYHYFGGSSGGWMSFQPGWIIAGTTEPLAWFWLKSLGIMFVLIIWGFLSAPRKVKIYSLPFWFVFIIANLIILQPRAWDNRKYFLYWYVMAAGLAGYFLSRLLFKRQSIYKVIAIALLLISTTSGAVDIFRLITPTPTPFVWAKPADLMLASAIRDKTAKNAVFLTAPTGSANPLANLMGRQIIMYTPGIGSSYGFNLWQQEAKLADIYQAKTQDKIPADYLIIGPAEHEFTSVNQEFFNQNFSTLIKTKDTIIYQL